MWKRSKHLSSVSASASATTSPRFASGAASGISRSTVEASRPSTSGTSVFSLRTIHAGPSTSRTSAPLGRPIPAGPSRSRTPAPSGRPIPAGSSRPRLTVSSLRSIHIGPSTSRASTSSVRPIPDGPSTSRASVPSGNPIRIGKRHIDDSDDEIERRAADRKPSHSGEKKKKYNEDHLRLQRMLRNSVLNDTRQNLISERRKLEQEKESYRQENTRLHLELDQSRRDFQTAKGEASLMETGLKKQAEFLRRQIKSKEKLIEEKTTEVTNLRRDLAEMEKQISAASTSSAVSATGEQKQPDSDFFLDVLANLKESIENQFSCSICTEVFINATTLHCGHSYCTGCLEEWERQNATCPVCRAEIKCKHPTKILDGYIEKFIGQYYSESAKAARTALVEDRVKQVAKRDRSARLAQSRDLDNDFDVRMLRINQLWNESRRREPNLTRLNFFSQLNATTDDDDDDDVEYTPARSSTPRTSTSSVSSVASYTIEQINEIFRTPTRIPRPTIYDSDSDAEVVQLEASDESNSFNISIQMPDEDDEPASEGELANGNDEPDAASESGSSDHAGNNTSHDDEEDEDDYELTYGRLSSSLGRLSSSFSHSSDGAIFSHTSTDSDDSD